MKRVLLISNSTLYGSGYLDHAASEIGDFLGNVKTVLFVPYALHDRRCLRIEGRENASGRWDTIWIPFTRPLIRKSS
jgi:hypothetical protein